MGLLTLALSLTGCGFISFVRISVNESITPDDVAFIVPGTTTFADVAAKLGTPEELTGIESGAVAVYHFRDAKYSRVNFGWPLQFFLPVTPELVMSGAGLGTDVFQVVYDARWVVQEHAFAHHVTPHRFIPWPFWSSSAGAVGGE